MKPFSEACEQNKWPILDVLRRELPTQGRVLEIGSGTGQHAVFFGEQLPGLTWVPSDLPEQHPGILAWLEGGPSNVSAPLALDVCELPWPGGSFDAVYSANTAHIMHWSAVRALFQGVGQVLRPDGVFVLYGPFNYDGCHTSESNAEFDSWLRMRDPKSGIRDFEALLALALRVGLELAEDVPMPVNNRSLVWRRGAR